MEIYWICAVITIYCMTPVACQEHNHEHSDEHTTTATTLPCEFTGLGGTWLGPTGNNIRIMSDDGHRWFDSSDDFECLQRAEQFYILKADGGEQQSILMCVCINQTADDIINVQYLTSGDQRARVVPSDAAVDSDELCNRDPNPQEFNVYMRSSDPSTIPSIQCPTCIQGVWGMIQSPDDMCQYGSSLDACDLHHEFTVNSWMSANVTNNQCGDMDNSTERTLSCSHYVKTENATYTLARDNDGQFYCLITQNADNGMKRLNWVQRDNVAARMPDCMPTNPNTYPYYQLQTDGHCSGFGGTSGSRNTHRALSLTNILFVMTLYIAV